MLAKAHITIGMAAAFTIMKPETVPDMLPVIAGASLGCLICDIDCENAREKTESSKWRAAMTIVAVLALVEDKLMDAGMLSSIAETSPYVWFAGIAIFIITITFASISSHRGFSHSILALAIETGSLWLILPVIAEPFAIAFTSHLILDLMNKRPVRLLYPAKKGYCLKLFYADKLANKGAGVLGSCWLIGIIFYLRSLQ